MSKNIVNQYIIDKICNVQVYDGQLLYSTTITNITQWDKIEPNTFHQICRLDVCKYFQMHKVKTNVLIKPFILGITDCEFEVICDYIKEYNIIFCTLGVMYYIDNTQKHNQLLLNKTEGVSENHLDCNGNIKLSSSNINNLRPYIEILQSKGITAFLKSSCVNANMMNIINESKYFENKSDYCVKCGNCSNDGAISVEQKS